MTKAIIEGLPSGTILPPMPENQENKYLGWVGTNKVWKDISQVFSAENVEVETTDWVSDSTYADYDYKADLTLTGNIATYQPEVVFGLTEVESGNFASICTSGTNIITIYAKTVPSETITIPLIKAVEL